jgi:hypothetical protein
VARPAVNQNPNILAQAALCESDDGILVAVTLRCARLVREIIGLKQVYREVVRPFAPLGINATSTAAPHLASFDLKQLSSNSVARQTMIDVANLIEHQIEGE